MATSRTGSRKSSVFLNGKAISISLVLGAGSLLTTIGWVWNFASWKANVDGRFDRAFERVVSLETLQKDRGVLAERLLRMEVEFEIMKKLQEREEREERSNDYSLGKHSKEPTSARIGNS